MAGKERLKGMPKMNAATLPVQAPVQGKGIATKVAKAINLPYFSALPKNLFLVLIKSQLKNLLNSFEFFIKKDEIGSSNQRRKTTGNKFPKKEIIKVVTIGNL